MQSTILTNIKKFLIAGLITIAFVLGLRGIIEFLHPKEGGLTWVVKNLFDESKMYWVVINISSPGYNFLIKNVWSNPISFWILVFIVLGLVLNKLKGKYT